MAYGNSRSVRFQVDLEATKYAPVNGDNVIKVKYKLDGIRQSEPASRKNDKKYDRRRKSLKAKVLSRVFSEDNESVNKMILDPRGHIFVRFRTAYVAPSSRVFGRGELVIDTSKIEQRYIRKDLLIDVVAAQPLPQATGVVTETAWAGVAYNLMLYMLASHVLGACWYLLSIERQEACWRYVCSLEKPSCDYGYFDC